MADLKVKDETTVRTEFTFNPALDIIRGAQSDAGGSWQATLPSLLNWIKANVASGVDTDVVAVQLATTANITLSGEQIIDGVLTSGSRVLVKNQTTQTQNGIYVSAAGAWARATDSDTTAELDGQIVKPSAGTANKFLLYAQDTPDPVIATDNIVYSNITGVYVSQAGAGTQAVNQIPTWSAVARRLTKGEAAFTYNSATNMLNVDNIGTVGATTFSIKTNNVSRQTILSTGLTGYGIAIPTAWQHWKATGYTTPMFRWESPDGVLTATAKNGEWNNVTDPLNVDLTIADYPNLQDIFPGTYIRIGTELMLTTTEVGTVRTFARGQLGTTNAVHADTAPIIHAYPVSMFWRAGDFIGGQDSPGQLGINCIPQAHLDIQKSNIAEDMLNLRLYTNSLFKINTFGRVGINLNTVAMNATAFMHVGVGAPNNMRFDNAMDIVITNAFSAGGAITHTGGGVICIQTTNGTVDLANNIDAAADFKIGGNFSRTANKGLYLKSAIPAGAWRDMIKLLNSSGAGVEPDIELLPSVVGNIRTFGATVGASGQGVVALANGTAPTAATAGCIQMFAKDTAAGNATISFFNEEAAIVDAALVSTHSMAVWVNIAGTLTEKKIMLA